MGSPTFDAHANLAYSTIATAPSPATSGTSLVVQSGDGAKFPAAPFNALIWLANTRATTANAEIVRVTAKATDTFTITRAQEGSSARTVIVGDQIAATITARTITDIEGHAPIDRRTVNVWYPDAGSASLRQAMANTPMSATGTSPVNAIGNSGQFLSCTTTASGNNGSGFVATASVRLEMNPTVIWKVKTGSVITVVCFRAMLSNAATIPTQDNPYTANRVDIGFRYSTFSGAYQGSTVSADAGWIGYVQESNATPFGNNKFSVTGSSAAIAASTEYELKMIANGVTSVEFFVNDVSIGTVPSTHITASTTLGYVTGVNTGENVAKTLQIRRMYSEHD